MYYIFICSIFFIIIVQKTTEEINLNHELRSDLKELRDLYNIIEIQTNNLTQDRLTDEKYQFEENVILRKGSEKKGKKTKKKKDTTTKQHNKKVKPTKKGQKGKPTKKGQKVKPTKKGQTGKPTKKPIKKGQNNKAVTKKNYKQQIMPKKVNEKKSTDKKGDNKKITTKKSDKKKITTKKSDKKKTTTKKGDKKKTTTKKGDKKKTTTKKGVKQKTTTKKSDKKKTTTKKDDKKKTTTKKSDKIKTTTKKDDKKKPTNKKVDKPESIENEEMYWLKRMHFTTTLRPLPPVTRGPNYDKFLENADLGIIPVIFDNAVKSSDARYPFMAQLKPRPFVMRPVHCTCVCVAPRIFITAARCLYGLSVGLISMEYLSRFLKVYGMVLSTNASVRWYDEIGMVITEDYVSEPPLWQPAKLFNQPRTDDYYKWFDDYIGKYEYSIEPTHKVLGYFASYDWEAYNSGLMSLDIFVGIRYCYAVFEGRIPPLPCYSYCRSTWYNDYVKSSKYVCDLYLSGEGFPIVNNETNEILGISTWTVGSTWGHKLPVGFAVPNSVNFYKNLECAKKIVQKTAHPKDYNYTNLQNIC